MPANRRTILLLEGIGNLPALRGLLGCEVEHADTPLEAARAAHEGRPSLIVIDGESPWQRAFVSNIPEARRPPVIALGGASYVSSSFADEFLPPRHTAEEAALRLRLAQERARARHQTARRAFTDPLTGLPNRRALLSTLVKEAARTRRDHTPLSLVLFDLDDFKKVNEQGGHPAGDRLLRRVGAALRSITRANEMSGRIGGDEFAMLISGELADAQRAAERAKEALRGAGVSASAATAQLQEGERIRELYRRTDELLHAAKQHRRSMLKAGARAVQRLVVGVQ
jgi:diguanylate cyclase (GGDEF)-like protein